MAMMQPGQQPVQIASGQYVQNPQMQPRLLYVTCILKECIWFLLYLIDLLGVKIRRILQNLEIAEWLILFDTLFRTMSDALSRLPPEVQQMAQQQINAETNAEKKRQVALGFIQGRVRVREPY